MKQINQLNLYAKLAREHFNGKQHAVVYSEFAGNVFEFRTYEVEVAVFGNDFHLPPKIHPVRVRLTDEEYLILCDIICNIELQVEDHFFGADSIPAYALNLSEIRRDTRDILGKLK